MNPDRPFRNSSRAEGFARRWSSSVSRLPARPGILKRFRVTSRWDGPASLVRRSPAAHRGSTGAFWTGCCRPRPLAVAPPSRGMSQEGLLAKVASRAINLRQFVIDLGDCPCPCGSACVRSSTVVSGPSPPHSGMVAPRLEGVNVLVDRNEHVSFIDLVSALTVAPHRARRARPGPQTRARRRSDSFFDQLRFAHVLNWALHGKETGNSGGDGSPRRPTGKTRNLRSGRPWPASFLIEADLPSADNVPMPFRATGLATRRTG